MARRRGGPTCSNQAGETVTRMVDGACIFLNRRGFPGGAGCALHRAARRVDETDDQGHVTSTLREWKRRDWGAGGFEFHWWCTDDHAAFVGDRPVYRALRDEIVAMVGETPYQMLVAHLDGRTGTLLPHPALRRR